MPRLSKTLFRSLVIPILKLIGPIFFDRKYLTGRHFEGQTTGWYWVWRSIFIQKIVGFNRHVPWPVSPLIVISRWENLIFDPDDLNNFQTIGCYYQNFSGKIVIGKGTYIAPNVGLITANHDPCDLNRHLPAEDVIIGEKCWLGMNSVILPGVNLGAMTVVGAGSVVTKSFPEGQCLIGGVPAHFIKKLECSD
ncbi:acyltransferase [Candidatus Acetothermia bacterium]|nr:acyltransferase [Candidatus Acetothermia bacterium]MBI3643989.1 acyltransferase [Candidatus Acetothermia bacterium]